MFNKNTLPNLTALILVLVSFTLPAPIDGIVLTTGLFALSGALTNWLAVHMLFERIPGLYGSGVITLHFEEFKTAIMRMVQEQLLGPDNIERLLKRKPVPSRDSGNSSGESPANSSGGVPPDHRDKDNGQNDPAAQLSLADNIDVAPLLESIDLDRAYDQLVATIVESSFGSVLAMVGGEAALEPMREPFRKKMSQFLKDAANSPRVRLLINEQIEKATSSDQFSEKLQMLLRSRLDELTPDMVKDIMQRMIKEHLGWLVVWGGVVGGLIGMATALLPLLFG